VLLTLPNSLIVPLRQQKNVAHYSTNVLSVFQPLTVPLGIPVLLPLELAFNARRTTFAELMEIVTLFVMPLVSVLIKVQSSHVLLPVLATPTPELALSVRLLVTVTMIACVDVHVMRDVVQVLLKLAQHQLLTVLTLFVQSVSFVHTVLQMKYALMVSVFHVLELLAIPLHLRPLTLLLHLLHYLW